MPEPETRPPRGLRLIAATIAVLCILLFAASLIPAGFAVHVFDTPGSGLSHTVMVWGRFICLTIMPLVALVGAIAVWRAGLRGNGRRIRLWSIWIALLAALWSIQAWPVYFT